MLEFKAENNTNMNNQDWQKKTKLFNATQMPFSKIYAVTVAS